MTCNLKSKCHRAMEGDRRWIKRLSRDSTPLKILEKVLASKLYFNVFCLKTYNTKTMKQKKY